MRYHVGIGVLQLLECQTWMGLFGAPTAKPTRLFSPDLRIVLPLKRIMSNPERKQFAAEAPSNTYQYFKDGRVKTQSFTKRMKKSQEYPDKYGAGVVDSYLKWREHQNLPETESSSDSDYESEKSPASWPEAMLGPMVKQLAKEFPGRRGHF